ncbi:MAG: endonuclease III domain-containing protein [Thermodesulfobacteriota bacterium]
MRRLKKQWQGCEDLRTKVRKITLVLEKQYGVPRREYSGDPLDILIETILSQNTNDQNRDRAYRGLKSRFPNWEDVLKGKARSIVSAIRPGGLAEQKAKRIREILRWIKEREGRLSLFFLEEMDGEEIKKTMGGLKGIGPKTLHCLLLFGFGKEAFPVDTHVLRTGKRLGFIPERMGAEKAHRWMAPLVPRGKSLSLHLNLIRFGRSVCKAKNPSCDACFVSNRCLSLNRSAQFAHPQFSEESFQKSS